MPRPLPQTPRLFRRKAHSDRPMLLGCPHVSPEWELRALRAIIKPQTRDAILHRPARQRLPGDFQDRVRHAMDSVAARLDYRPEMHWPEAGDYLFLTTVLPNQTPEARALAVVLSRQLPGTWIVLGRVFVRDGRFFRRKRGFKLELVPANGVNLTRPIRAALRGIL